MREGGGREGGGREGEREKGWMTGKGGKGERITIIYMFMYSQIPQDNTQHYVPTLLRHTLNVGVRESDKGECSRLGGDRFVKENAVHGAGEVQL